jgi:membrane fusion protein, multidrug efflux system
MAQEQSRGPADLQDDDTAIDSVPLYRKKRIIIPTLIFIVAALAGLWYWYVSVRGTISTDDAFVDGNRVTVSSKLLGRVQELGAAEGDTVHTGQVLVRIDDSDLRAQEVQATAAVASAEASVDPALIAYEKAQEDLTRSEAEYSGGAITKEQYDHARKALDAARAEKTVALSRVTTAKAQLDVVKTQLRNTAISSPIDGVVAKRWVLTGDVVQPGQPIFSVYDTREIWVTANFEETRLSLLHQGDTVEISVDAYPDQKFSGRIFQLGSYTASQFSLIPPNNASGNFTKVTQRVPVKISVVADRPGMGPALLPGMSVEVKIRTH